MEIRIEVDYLLNRDKYKITSEFGTSYSQSYGDLLKRIEIIKTRASGDNGSKLEVSLDLTSRVRMVMGDTRFEEFIDKVAK